MGARLDEQPELLFRLRGVDERELIQSAGRGKALAQPAVTPRRRLDMKVAAELFGIELARPRGRKVIANAGPPASARKSMLKRGRSR